MAKLLLLFDPVLSLPIEIYPTNEQWCDENFLPELIDSNQLIRTNEIIKNVKIDLGEGLYKFEYNTYESGVMRKIIFSDGRTIRFNLWGKDQVSIASSYEKQNVKASIIRNPNIKQFNKQKIFGKCLFEPYDETPLKTGDWYLIREALFENKELIEKNCKANGIDSHWSDKK